MLTNLVGHGGHCKLGQEVAVEHVAHGPGEPRSRQLCKPASHTERQLADNTGSVTHRIGPDRPRVVHEQYPATDRPRVVQGHARAIYCPKQSKSCKGDILSQTGRPVGGGLRGAAGQVSAAARASASVGTPSQSRALRLRARHRACRRPGSVAVPGLAHRATCERHGNGQLLKLRASTHTETYKPIHTHTHTPPGEGGQACMDARDGEGWAGDANECRGARAQVVVSTALQQASSLCLGL